MNITCAKEMQDYLEVTHEKTNEIKNSNINMLTQEFESLNLLPNVELMIFLTGSSISPTTFNHLKRVTYHEMNIKVLRSLPNGVQQLINPIVIYKDIKKLSSQELMGI